MPTIIKSVDPGSPGARARIRPGERLLSVNGKPIIDVLDYQYYTYDQRLTMVLQNESGKNRKVRIKKEAGEDLGLVFETYLMDKARSCANHCVFCFVDQLPKGMRNTLYFKDDDARLSFLMGNYITLTNLSKRELERIIDLRISPINLSIHSTDPVLRSLLLGNPKGGETLSWVKTFADAGITMNCQIVSCPGLNDGAALDRTMQDLSNLYPSVSSVSIVPVGLTKHREGLYPLSPYTKIQAEAVIDQVEAFGAMCKVRLGSTVFFCSDEFYLIGERPLPQDSYYEGYPQLENGVGMLRLLQTEFEEAMEAYAEKTVSPSQFSIATGISAAPFLQDHIDRVREKWHTVEGTVFPIQNHFFGETIVVAGLITGQDLVDQLRGKKLGRRLLLPVNMLRHGQNVFLDDFTLEQVSNALGVQVQPVEQNGEALLRAILEIEGDA